MVSATKPDLAGFAFFLRYPPERNGKRRPKGETTVAAYLYTVERYLSFLEGRESNQDNARAFVESLEVDNGARSVGRHIYALRAYFQFLGEELELGAPSYPQRQPRWLNDDEWRGVLETVELPLANSNAHEWAKRRALFKRAAVMVYGGAGLRLAEGCRLTRDNLDPAGYLTVLGKGGVELTVPVEDAVVTSLQDWLACHDSRFVFPGKAEDSSLNPRTMQAVISAVLTEAGIENIHRSVHMLRHTAGADLRKRGADIRDIQQFLRHSNIQSTQIYTQMAQEDLRQKLPKRFTARQGRML